jgi:hypothetical protein
LRLDLLGGKAAHEVAEHAVLLAREGRIELSR